MAAGCRGSRWSSALVYQVGGPAALDPSGRAVRRHRQPGRRPRPSPRRRVVVGAVAVGDVLGLCLLASVYVLVSAWRPRHTARRASSCCGWWPAPCRSRPAMIASFVVSFADHDVVAGWMLSVCVVTLVARRGLSVARYRLYDVERVVTDSAAYALASARSIAVVRGGRGGQHAEHPRRLRARSCRRSLATLAGVGVARPAYVWARSAVDRRFNRRRFDAVETCRAGLRRPARGPRRAPARGAR